MIRLKNVQSAAVALESRTPNRSHPARIATLSHLLLLHPRNLIHPQSGFPLHAYSLLEQVLGKTTACDPTNYVLRLNL